MLINSSILSKTSSSPYTLHLPRRWPGDTALGGERDKCSRCTTRLVFASVVWCVELQDHQKPRTSFTTSSTPARPARFCVMWTVEELGFHRCPSSRSAHCARWVRRVKTLRCPEVEKSVKTIDKDERRGGQQDQPVCNKRNACLPRCKYMMRVLFPEGSEPAESNE